MDRRRAHQIALNLAPHTAAVANYCDHAEHNEGLDRLWVLTAARALREAAAALCRDEQVSLVELYAQRLHDIESRNVVHCGESFAGPARARQACTWRDLQLVQIQHDRAYHSDVAGLAKFEQLRHYALHLAKIVGAFAEGDDGADLMRRRTPDALIFGLKLSTVMGERLEEAPLPTTGQGLGQIEADLAPMRSVL